MSETVKLTKAQREWLAAHERGGPVSMEWLDAEHASVGGPPDTWVYLMATWDDGRTAAIHADERPALADYFDPGKWELTPAGREALASMKGTTP